MNNREQYGPWAVVTGASDGIGRMWAALGRRVTVVPGGQARLLTASLNMLPRGVSPIILGRVMASMRPR